MIPPRIEKLLNRAIYRLANPLSGSVKPLNEQEIEELSAWAKEHLPQPPKPKVEDPYVAQVRKLGDALEEEAKATNNWSKWVVFCQQLGRYGMFTEDEIKFLDARQGRTSRPNLEEFMKALNEGTIEEHLKIINPNGLNVFACEY